LRARRCVKAGIRIHNINGYSGLRRDQSAFGFYAVGCSTKPADNFLGIVRRDVPNLKIDLARVRNNVERHTRIYLAGVNGRIRDVIVAIVRSIDSWSLLLFTQRTNEILAKMDRVESEGRKSGMPRSPSAHDMRGNLTLMSGCDVHFGRFVNNAKKPLVRSHSEHRQQAVHAYTTNLFIVGERKLQWCLEIPLRGL
jgi:hypothetical protein